MFSNVHFILVAILVVMGFGGVVLGVRSIG